MIMCRAVIENTSKYLCGNGQMDKYLEKGYSLYIEGDEEYLLATPEKGYLREKPDISPISTAGAQIRRTE